MDPCFRSDDIQGVEPGKGRIIDPALAFFGADRFSKIREALSLFGFTRS
jgi:hypothetical protein